MVKQGSSGRRHAQGGTGDCSVALSHRRRVAVDRAASSTRDAHGTRLRWRRQQKLTVRGWRRRWQILEGERRRRQCGHTVAEVAESVVKQRGLARKLREVRPAPLLVRDELSVVRCPPQQLEEGNGNDDACWRSRRPTCGSHGSGGPLHNSWR
jgi:hypothetical protein